MARSRSSFDLSRAIATATSLTPSENARREQSFEGVALVSFGVIAAASAPEAAPVPPRHATPPPPPPAPPLTEVAPEEAPEAARPSPPKLPDLSAIQSPGERCERIVTWIAEATGATDVFIADAAGLPMAGAIADAEAQLASSGVVASSIASLAAATPGSTSAIFELHLGEGPFFQLIGFQAGSALFVVGLTRSTPLTPRQAHAIRLACRHALGDTLGGAA